MGKANWFERFGKGSWFGRDDHMGGNNKSTGSVMMLSYVPLVSNKYMLDEQQIWTPGSVDLGVLS